MGKQNPWVRVIRYGTLIAYCCVEYPYAITELEG